MTEPSPRRTLLHPASALGVVLLLPILGAARWRADIVILCLLWLGFCRLLVDRWFGRARPDDGFDPAVHTRLRSVLHRHAAGLLMTVLGGVGVVFVRAWGLWAPLLFIAAPVLIAESASARFRYRAQAAFARVPLLTAVICLLATLGAYRSVAPQVGWPDTRDDFLYPLRANPSPEPLTAEEQTAAVKVVRAALTGREIPTDLPARLTQTQEHRAWVTLFRKARRGRWTRGEATGGQPLVDQLVAAAKDAQANAVGRIWRTVWESARIQVDLEGPQQRMGARWFRRLVSAPMDALMGFMPWNFIQYDCETGVDGFTLRRGEQEGTVLPADVMIDGWTTPRKKKSRYRAHNQARIFRELRRRGGFEDGDPWPEGTELINFRTHSFAEPDPQADPGRTITLHRGNVLFDGELTEERLLDAIAAAGEWLLGTVEEDGRFDYEYFPSRDDHGKGYNEVRHAGSVYGLFHLANLAAKEPTLTARRTAYIDAGVKAFDRVYGMLGTPPEVTEADGFVAFLEGKDGAKTNSGAQALVLLSFLERPAELARPGDDALMAGLAKTLVAMVDERGWVYRKWTEARAGEQMEQQPLYFPGELLLALVRYHEHTGDADILEVAQRVGRAQIDYAKRPFEIPDHWVMQGLDHLDALDPDDPVWRAGAYWMGADYADEQFPPQIGHEPDYLGAYRRDLEIARTTRAAARGEAIGGVARIAWRHGDPAGVWERSLLGGARHLIEQQYTADNTFHFPVPEETFGAIRMGLIDNHCRIDNNQHAIVALGNALQALRRQQ